MTTPNLPDLDKKNSRILPFDRSGAWVRLKSLDDLAQSLELPASQMDLAQLKSVPDPWGQITSFRDSLFALGDAHPAHRSAVQIWRAMLAILGLRAFQSRFTIHTEAVDLETKGPGGDLTDLFCEIALRFVPNDTFDARLGWKKLWLVLASVDGGDELLGLISPLTLIAPARGIRPDLLCKLTGDLQNFGSPLGSSLYTPEQLRALQLFVGSLAGSVRTAAPGSGRLIELLNDYQRDLEAAGATDTYPQPSQVTRPLGDLSAQTNFAALDRVWEPGIVPEAASDSAIFTSETFKKVFEGAVLADPALSITIGRPADRIVLWRGWRLSALADLDAIRQDAHRFGSNGYVVVTPDDLFSPILTPFDKATISAHGAGELSQMLLPVTPLALLLWPTRDLLDRLTVRADGTDRWIAELRVSLVGRNGKPYDHVLRREYHAPQARRGETASLALVENNVRAIAPAALAGWPDFAGPQWRWNFLYFDAQHKQAAVPTSGFSAQMLIKDLNGRPNGGARWDRIAEWASPEGPWKGPSTRQMDDEQRSWFERIRFATKDPDQGDGKERELQRCDTAFDAVSFVVNDPSRVLPGSKLGPQFAGVGLLPPSIVAPQVTELGAEVATDFGTTNTIIYAKCAGQQRELQFAPRLRPFDSSRDPKTSFESYSSFLPAQEIAPPFTTVMQGRPFSLRADVSEELINKARDPALWRDYIFFDKDIATTMSSIWDGANGALHFNIKWSTSEKERERIARFLRQAGFMTLAELAARGVSPGEVQWRYSYPLAMSEADRADFQHIARKVVGQLRDPGEGGIKVAAPALAPATPREPVAFCSESTAAAVWFQRNARFSTTSQIVIDIGGGTTDLALWANDSPVWSDSFRIAGRNLVVEFLAQNRDFLTSLGVLETILQSTDYRSKFLETGTNQEKFTDAVGVIVNSTQFAAALRDRFSGIAGSPAGKKLQCGAYLFLGGLLYYVGLQVKALLEKSDQDLLHANHLRTLSVCFAGRGSTLFTLLNEKRQGMDSHLNRCLKLFVAGIQSPLLTAGKLSAEAYFSPRPKHEVSEGMLYWDAITRSGPKETFSVLGEVVEGELADGSKKRLEPTEPESALEQLKRLGSPLVEEFAKFLEQLAELTGVKFTLGRAHYGHLETKVAEALRTKLNPTAQSVHDDPDPPFIVMLRETLQKLYATREGDSAIRVELR